MSGISAAYDADFFAMHQPWRAEYDAIADALAHLIDFSSVLDLGCGNGFILDRLHQHGRSVRGVDGSVHALQAAPPSIREKLTLADLTAPLRLGRHDLVICSEVAEHLAAHRADRLVDTICAHCGRWVFFTAATPGQGGHSHVNEQPHDYWIAKFARRGLRLDPDMTQRLRSELAQALHTAWWFARNATILHAPPGAL
jgi:predicted TPR repeat methyltransferase